MPISLRRSPFLVQKEIIQHMSIQESIFLSTTSKKARALVKCSLHFQEFHIEYHVDRLVHSVVVIKKDRKKEVDRMTVISVKERRLWGRVPNPTLKFLDQNVEVANQRERVSRVYVYLNDATPFVMEVYQYSMELLSKATKLLNFSASDSTTITNTMNLANVDEVVVDLSWSSEVIETALNGCAKTKKLRLRNCHSSDVRLNPDLRFNLDYLYIEDSEWLHKEHIIQNFLNCKQVILPRTSFGLNELDYPEFVKSWMKGSKMELLQIGRQAVEHWWQVEEINEHRITDTIGILPGAVEVRRAILWEDEEEPGDWLFEAGCCYMVQQADGTRAIVSWTSREFLLTTKFEILEEATTRAADQ